MAPNLLNLPTAVRKKILRDAGLVRKCPISLREKPRDLPPYRPTCNMCSLQTESRSRFINGDEYKMVFMESIRLSSSCPNDCPCKLPVTILRTCKALYQEGNEVFYSENVFYLHIRDGADSLLGLNQFSVSLLKALYINGMTPSYSTGPSSDKFVSIWHAVVRKLGDITKDQLDLTVEFFFTSDSSLEDIVRPLSALRRLRQFRLLMRHVKSRNLFPDYLTDKLRPKIAHLTDRFNELVKQIKIRPQLKTGVDVDGPCFPLLKLPNEMKRLVLEHTDLWVRTPTRMRLTGGDRSCYEGYVAVGVGTEGNVQQLSAMDDCRGRHPTCWGSCSTLFMCIPHHPGPCWCIHKPDNDLAAGDSLKFSSTCTCLRPATALFRVNRLLSELALEVFYGKNHFFIAGDMAPVLKKATQIPPKYLRLMRHLVLQIEDNRWPEEIDPSILTNFLDLVHASARKALQVRMILPGPLSDVDYDEENPFRGILSLLPYIEERDDERVTVFAVVRPFGDGSEKYNKRYDRIATENGDSDYEEDTEVVRSYMARHSPQLFESHPQYFHPVVDMGGNVT